MLYGDYSCPQANCLLTDLSKIRQGSVPLLSRLETHFTLVCASGGLEEIRHGRRVCDEYLGIKADGG